MTHRFLTALTALGLFCSLCHGQLLIDFNSTNQDGGPNNDTAGGFSAYDAGHEVADDFVTQTYSAFGTDIGVTPSWPNTTDNRVQQMIDRGAGNDANWMDADTDLEASPVPILGLNFVTDFLGTDTRTGNGGNGDWDGTDGTPTYLNIALSGLPANSYTWQSAHIDTENLHGEFQVNVSVDGGANFSALPNGRLVNSSPGGNPNAVESGFLDALIQDSTMAALGGAVYTADFMADGTNDVVIQFAPLSQNAVHRQIFAVNGFVLSESAVVPEPSTNALMVVAAFGLFGIARRRR